MSATYILLREATPSWTASKLGHPALMTVSAFARRSPLAAVLCRTLLLVNLAALAFPDTLPQLLDIQIDASPSDWQDSGLSGEALPNFFWKRIWQPLGATHSEMRSMSWNTQAAPWEIALVGQLQLNQGRYGALEFFSPETCRQLLSRPVELASGLGSWNEYGIGMSWFRNDGYGPNTYGHGAASSATLRIDPDTVWGVVMTRNRAGRNFRHYHTEFLRLVAYSALP